MAAAKKEKTEAYVVTRRGTRIKGQDQKVGMIVQLTERQGRALVNKVVLKTEADKAAGGVSDSQAAKALADAAKQIAELEAKVAQLEAK